MRTRLISLMLCMGIALLSWTTTPCCAQDSTEPIDSAIVSPAQVEQAAEQALTQIEGLEDADVTVSGTSLTIRGTADDVSVIQAAERAVIAATGAEQVNNEIKLSLDLEDRTRGAANRVSQRFESWIGYLPVIPIAVAVLIVFAFIAWLLGKLRWPYARFTRNPFLQDILRRLTQSAVLLTGVLLALEIINAMALVGGVLGAAGVAGLAIGFAFRDLIENYIASVLLSLRQPFKPQDHVQIDGHEGLVTAMNTRTTVLTTFDGNVVRIPNATVFKTTLINYTSEARRRFGFTIGVGYGVNLPQTIELSVQTLKDTPGVLTMPRPVATVKELGDSVIVLQIFGWVDQSVSSFGSVRSNAMQNVKAQFDLHNIEMPESIYKVRVEGSVPSGLPGSPAETPPQSHVPRSDQTARGDTSRDSTIEEMSHQTARAQGDDNLLDERAPSE